MASEGQRQKLIEMAWEYDQLADSVELVRRGPISD